MPNIYMIGGPNGAGKTTSAMSLMPELLSCDEYVNADAIASGLSPFKPESSAIKAGRLMLQKIRDLANSQKDFAFETTMASRTFLPFLSECKENGYAIRLLYLWLHSPELALKRVESRVLSGGHHVPDEFVIRRYRNGLKNFFNLYIPIADTWLIYDNSSLDTELIARKDKESSISINNQVVWEKIQEKIK